MVNTGVTWNKGFNSPRNINLSQIKNINGRREPVIVFRNRFATYSTLKPEDEGVGATSTPTFSSPHSNKADDTHDPFSPGGVGV